MAPIVIERFGRTTQEKLTTGEVPFRKAYLGGIADRVEVHDREIHIVGRKGAVDVQTVVQTIAFPSVLGFTFPQEVCVALARTAR